VVDEKVSKYGKLLFVYQNLDDFVLEKIYYLDFYIKELNKLKKKLENKKIQYTPQKAKIDYIDYKNYERFINKFSSQIKQALKIVFEAPENLVKDEVKKYIINLSKKINTNIKVGRIVDYLYIHEK
jgi:predicted ATP-binding protein involved in virulence